MSFTRALVVAGTFMLAATPAFAADFESGSVGTNAFTQVGFGSSGGDPEFHQIITGGVTTNLAAIQAKAHSQFKNNNNGGVVTLDATSDSKASWANANSGQFVSTRHSSMSLPHSADDLEHAQVEFGDQNLGQNPSFDYKFTATGNDNLLTVGYSFDFTGSNADPKINGMGAFTLDLEEIIQGKPSVPVSFLMTDAVNGSFTGALKAGHDYELKIRDSEGLLLPDSLFGNRELDLHDTATFNFNIGNDGTGGGGTGAVPEPASWALMLGGFGMVGGAMRSRRRSAVSFS